MNSTMRHYFKLLSSAIVAAALGFGIAKIIIEVADLKPRCSPDCSCVARQEQREPGRQEVTPER